MRMETKILITTSNKLMKSFKFIQKSLFITIIVIFSMPAQLQAQVIDWNSEFEFGFTKFKEGNWKEAFPHLEKIANALPSLGLDENGECMIYFACGTCAQQMGDIKKCIQYNTKALAISGIPVELRIQLLTSQLDNYSGLSMKNECERIINDMMGIYRSRKDINLVHEIMSYYLKEGKFSKVIEFEKDIPNFIVPLATNEMDKISNSIQWNSIYVCLAHSYDELKMYDKALNYFQKGLDTTTEYNKEMQSAIYESISKIYNKTGDKKSALKYQKLAVESEK